MAWVIFHKKNNFSSVTDNNKTKQKKVDADAGCISFFLATILLVFNISWFYLAFLLIPSIKIISKKKIKNIHRLHKK
jgi:hypothetical protein